LLGGENCYTYAVNSVSWVDPLGLKCKEVNRWNEFQHRAKGQFKDSTEAAKAYNHLKEGKIEELAKMLDFTAPDNGSVFWSGGSGAMKESQNYANSIGGKTLEMTKGGKIFDGWDYPSKLFPQWFSGVDPDNPIGQRGLWEAISAEFANSAKGKVTAVQAVGKDLKGTIWQEIEEPLLSANSDVSKIEVLKVDVSKTK